MGLRLDVPCAMSENERDATLGAIAGGSDLGRRAVSRRDVLRGATVAGVGAGLSLLAPGGLAGAASRFPLGAAAKAKSHPVSITMWHSMTEALLTALTGLTNQFNASQSNIHVNLVEQNSYPDTQTAYTTALSGGTSELPDIVQWETELIQILIDSQSVVPAASAIAADHFSFKDFVPSMVDCFKVNGTQWAMPFNTSSQVLYYDQNAFTKAGLDPTNPPTDLAQLRTAAQKIVSTGTAKYGMSLKLDYTNFELWMSLGGQTILNHNNGRSGRATAVTFDDALGKAIFEWWGGMMSDKLAQRTPFTTYDNLLAIGSGIAPITIDTSASLGTITQVLSTGEYPNVKLGVAPLPWPTAKHAKNGGAFVGGAGLYMVKKPTPATIDASWQFIKFLVTPKAQATWASGTGYMPIRKSAVQLAPLVATWAEEPGYEVAYRQLLASPANAATAGSVTGAAPELGPVVLNNALSTLAAGGSPATALAQAAANANAAISSYNERV
jgi:sn-glycerol 3-phosphate transport system substrate-binding protein